MKWDPHVLLTAHLASCRYSYNEEEGELPEWFTEEERQHRRRQLPVDKQTVEAYRQRWKEINARPIKKVAEAKARKKRRVSEGGLPGVPWLLSRASVLSLTPVSPPISVPSVIPRPFPTPYLFSDSLSHL